VKIQSINPSTGELIKEFESASVQDVTKAVEKARMGQKKWGSLPKKDRIDIVSNLKDVIKKRKQVHHAHTVLLVILEYGIILSGKLWLLLSRLY